MPLISSLRALLRLGRPDAETWPYVAGKYKVVDPIAPVVVVFGDAEALAEDIVQLSARGLCMVAPYCRSASDAEKLLRNVAANLAVQYVIVAGEDGDKQPAVDALCATLSERDPKSDAALKLAESLNTKLQNLDMAALRKQVKPIDMIGCMDADRIIAKISEVAVDASRPNTGFRMPDRDGSPGIERVIAATQITYEAKIDKAGDFVIRTDGARIVVEHYNSKRELIRVIEGENARDLCITLIRNGWVSKLDHAAYLGRELMRAEWAVQAGRPYVQDADQITDTLSPQETKH